MSRTVKVTRSTDAIPIRWLLGCILLVTLYFNPKLADPFNSPKLWILLVISSWLAGYVVSFRKRIFGNKSVKNFYYLIILFLIILTIAVVTSDFKYIAIFGETQRRNGFLQYFSLSIVIIAASLFVRVYNIKKLVFVTYFIGSTSVVYSLLQTTGNDFVAWNNPYNSVISTLGNPNFAAAVMAIVGVITFGSVFIPTLKYNQRIFAAGLSLFLLFAIFRSNARQGLIAYALGVGTFLVIWLWVKNKKYGYISAALGMIFFVSSVLGMLQIGPLERYLYKSSVSIRGYYWRASIEMLINHPFFGVGIDSYGHYFKEFREVNYPLTYGFQLTSTNAHNTFLQFFATGGIFLGIAYLALNGYILNRAIFGIKNLTGSNRLYLSAVFSAWLAFHAQSLISIDNIGISVWGWFLGGAIIGLSVSSSTLSGGIEELPQLKKSTINLGRVATSGFATLLAAVLVAILYRGESNSYRATQVYNLQDPATRAYFKELQLGVIDTPLIDPTYKLVAASNLLQSGFVDEGLREANKIYEENPRNLDTLNLLALAFEQLNNTANAMEIREKIVLLDPWNAENYLALGKIYKNQGDLTKSNAMLAKILSFASKHPISSRAKEELGS